MQRTGATPPADTKLRHRLGTGSHQQESPRQVYDFNFDWLFHKGDVGGAEAANFADTAWRKLRLPHDWSIEERIDRDAPAGGGGGYFPTGIGWYRKHFQAPNRADGRRVWIEFDGIYEDSTVWINGHELGFRPYGYIGFQYDLTPRFRREDPTRPVTTGNDHIAADGRSATPEFLNMLDIVGYNYMDRWHERREIYISGDRINHPDWLQVGTESTAVRGSRGRGRGFRFGRRSQADANQYRLPRGPIRAQASGSRSRWSSLIRTGTGPSV